MLLGKHVIVADVNVKSCLRQRDSAPNDLVHKINHILILQIVPFLKRRDLGIRQLRCVAVLNDHRKKTRKEGDLLERIDSLPKMIR